VFGGNSLPDHGVPPWKGRVPEEEQPHRPRPLPTEDIGLQELFAHTTNTSAIRTRNTTDYTQRAPTLRPIVLTFCGTVHPSIQLASTVFSDFSLLSAEKPVPMMGSQLFLLPLNFILIETAQSYKSFFVGDGRDLVERYLPIVSNREGIV
jgi:hypothetical protein